MISSSPAIRVLHVVGGMNRGGVETWLMHVLRNIDRRRLRMDFLVHTDDRCAYDDEIRAFGSRIIPCLPPSRPWTYARNLRRILREYGPYDVVHSHVLHFSGFVLRIAAQCRVPVRVAHSHNDTSRTDSRASLARRLYLHISKGWIRRHATNRLACSTDAAACLYGRTWQEQPAAEVLYCGIDLKPFERRPDREKVRAGLGIPRDAFVLGHVGRFSEQKNHDFLVEIAAETVKRESRAVLLLIGEGALEGAIREKVRRLGLPGRVIFAGSRSDVPEIVAGAMDVFVFPSLYEGLGLAAVEAQAAGLPCFVSDRITTEAHVVKPLIQSLSLADTPSAWADRILGVRDAARAVAGDEALAMVAQTPFNITSSVASLHALYDGCRC